MRRKWHVGLTFFDKDGQPIRGDGVEAVERVDFSRRIAGGPRTTASTVSLARRAVPRRTGSTRSSKATACPCRRRASSTRRRCPNIPTPTTAGLASSHEFSDGGSGPCLPQEEPRVFWRSMFASRRANRSFSTTPRRRCICRRFPAKPVQGQDPGRPARRFHHELDYVVGELWPRSKNSVWPTTRWSSSRATTAPKPPA